MLLFKWSKTTGMRQFFANKCSEYSWSIRDSSLLSWICLSPIYLQRATIGFQSALLTNFFRQHWANTNACPLIFPRVGRRTCFLFNSYSLITLLYDVIFCWLLYGRPLFSCSCEYLIKIAARSHAIIVLRFEGAAYFGSFHLKLKLAQSASAFEL